MTAEDRCKVCKELLEWAKYTKAQVKYMEEKIYAVRVSEEMVVLVKASSANKAMRMVWEADFDDLDT